MKDEFPLIPHQNMSIPVGQWSTKMIPTFPTYYSLAKIDARLLQSFLRDLLREASKSQEVTEDKLIEYTDTMVSTVLICTRWIWYKHCNWHVMVMGLWFSDLKPFQIIWNLSQHGSRHRPDQWLGACECLFYLLSKTDNMVRGDKAVAEPRDWSAETCCL